MSHDLPCFGDFWPVFQLSSDAANVIGRHFKEEAANLTSTARVRRTALTVRLITSISSWYNFFISGLHHSAARGASQPGVHAGDEPCL